MKGSFDLITEFPTVHDLTRVNESPNERGTVSVPEKPRCSSRAAAVMSGLHHHKQHPTTKMRREVDPRRGDLGHR